MVLRLLRPANQQATKPIQPAVRSLHHPTVRTPSSLPLLRFLTARSNVWPISQFNGKLLNLQIVISLVQAQPLRPHGKQ